MKLVFNKKTILLLGALLLVVTSALGLLVRAWLTDQKLTVQNVVTVGDVEFTWAGEIGPTTGYVVPGQNLATTPFTLTNSSTVATELRVAISVMYGSTPVDGTDLVKITFGEVDGWILDSGYYYYRGTNATNANSKWTIAAGTQVLSFITEIALDGAKVGNTFTNTPFTFQFTFQAKQNDYVAWGDMGSINFETGIAN